MNRKQFQEWLDQFPEETIIEVGVQQSPPSYCPYGDIQFEVFEDCLSKDHFEYTDLDKFKSISEEHFYYGKKVLQLGSSY